MNTKPIIAFVADYFADEVPGGGEINNDELIKLLSKDFTILKVKSKNLDPAAIANGLVDFYIVSNFLELSYQSYTYLIERANYLIYEHDHKYVKNRNPAEFKNFVAPKTQIVNYKFYENAKAILCQSNFHADIVKKNLGFETIKSLSGNLWSPDSLDLMSDLSRQEKLDVCAIMKSENWHKNTIGAVRYCKLKNLSHVLIPSCEYHDFLSRLSTYRKLVFFPQTPETLSRIAVEARMMGMAVVTNQNVGATKEHWFSLKGDELINVMRSKRDEIANIVKEVING